MYVEHKFWKLARKSQEPRGQPERRERDRATEFHANGTVDAEQLVDTAREGPKGRLNMGQKSGTGRRQPDASALTLEQLFAQGGFQEPDLLADRGLGQSDFGAGLREIEPPGGGLECPNPGQIRHEPEFCHKINSAIAQLIIVLRLADFTSFFNRNAFVLRGAT